MPPKDFLHLDDAEAEAFFAAFVARAPGRLEEFKREVAARRGPAEAELDGTPESLIGCGGGSSSTPAMGTGSYRRGTSRTPPSSRASAYDHRCFTTPTA